MVDSTWVGAEEAVALEAKAHNTITASMHQSTDMRDWSLKLNFQASASSRVTPFISESYPL